MLLLTDDFGATRVQLKFLGTDYRKYDAGISWAKQSMANPGMKRGRLIAYALRSDIPNYSPVPMSVSSFIFFIS